MLKLVLSLTSPFARKVRIVLAEKRIDYEPVIDIPWDADTKVPQYNPLGKVPVLVLDDGTTLFDSRVIVEYLDTISPVSRLIPEPSRQRIAVRRWEALADGVCDAGALIVLEQKRAASKQDKTWIARQQLKIDLGLKAMAEELGEKSWCSGDAYNLADIAAGVALGYMDFRFPEIGWRDQYANLARFYEKVMQRQAFKDTVPPQA